MKVVGAAMIAGGTLQLLAGEDAVIAWGEFIIIYN